MAQKKEGPNQQENVEEQNPTIGRPEEESLASSSREGQAEGEANRAAGEATE